MHSFAVVFNIAQFFGYEIGTGTAGTRVSLSTLCSTISEIDLAERVPPEIFFLKFARVPTSLHNASPTHRNKSGNSGQLAFRVLYRGAGKDAPLMI